MPEPTGTLEKLANTVGQALLPLETFFARANVVAYFAQLGTVFPDSLASDLDVGPTLDAVSTTAGGLNTALTNLANAQDAAGIVAAGADIIGQFVTLLNDLDAVATQIGAKSWTPLGTADVAAFVDQFSAKVFEDALLRTLERDRPEFISAGVLIGIIDRFRTTIAGADPADPVQFVTTRRLQLGGLADALSSPVTYLQNLVGWGGGSLDINKLLTRLQAFLDLFSYGTLIDTSSGSPVLKASMLTASLNSAGATPGIDLVFNLGVPDGFTFTAPLRPGYDISVSAAGQLPAGLTITARPPSQLSVASPVTITLSSVLTRKPFGDEAAVVILGQTGATRLQADAITLAAGMTLKADPGNSTASGDIFVRFEFVGGKAVIDSSKGDGFLQKIGPANPVEAPFQLAATWSVSGGLQLSGGAALVLTLPINLTVGPINVPSIYLAFGVQNGKFPLEVSADLNATLGPVGVSVSRVGVLADLSFPTAPARGNLGPADLDVHFKFPTGIGISIDTGSVSGGGFLFFDPTNGRYGGAIELLAYDINVKAFGLIETKVPGVSFSFVIVISAEFTPIQLGLGFTLDGVGGLLGINRKVDDKAVADAVKSGSLDDVLFPHDVVANAPKIISELAALFPAADGRYVIGPMAKLSWLEIVHGTLGVLFQWPSKKLTILGTIDAVLPDEANAIVLLKMDVGGTLDFPGKHFALDAVLDPDSRVGDFPISGAMAMRLDWGDKPNFALSIGGFNKAYSPPPGFPPVRRMTVDLGAGVDLGHVTLEGYTALTSNTAQVGARLDASVSKYGATLSGFVAFDALIVFSPFQFSADLAGGVHVDFEGIGFGMDLHGHISGPSPWVIDGEVCVSVWFADACVGFHEVLGGEAKPTIPSIDPWFGEPWSPGIAFPDQDVGGLEPAIRDLRNWKGDLPAGAFVGVSYREQKPPVSRVDPVGVATFTQKVVPLDYPIDMFVGAPSGRNGELKITGATSGTVGATPSPVKDFFAPAQYKDMPDADKLSSDSFEPLDAGVAIVSQAVTIGAVQPKTIQYRTFEIQASGAIVERTDVHYTLDDAHLDGMATGSSAARPPVRFTGRLRFIDPTLQRKLTDKFETYLVVIKSSLNPVQGLATGVTWTQAAALRLTAAGPFVGQKRLTEVIPTSFLAAA